jgi:ABC-type uncharacterized transport system substrate-binding protein
MGTSGRAGAFRAVLSMQRREFIALLGCTGAAWASAAHAQLRAVRRVGILTGMLDDAVAQLRTDAFHQRLRELGWVKGTDVQTQIVSAVGDPEFVRSRAKEMVDSAPDVLVAASLPAAIALHEQTHSIPIVFLLVTNPASNRLVTNLARPDTNMTGFTNFQPSMGGKWLEILRDIAPRTTRVALMFDPDLFPFGPQVVESIRAAASAVGVPLSSLPVRDAGDIEHAISGLAGQPNSGLIVLADNTVVQHRTLIVSLAAKASVPAIYPYRYFATAGGLVSYGVDTIALYARAAEYVDRLLRGAKVAELPVQQPMNFELVLNLRAARSLGLDVSQTTIASANEVIE